MAQMRSTGVSTKAYCESRAGDKYGNYIVAADANAIIKNPSWSNDQASETVFRLLPPPNPAVPGQFLPTRMLMGEYGDEAHTWLVRYDTARYFGSVDDNHTGISMLLHPEVGDPNYNIDTDNPFGVLVQAITRACKNGTDQQGWASLIQGVRPVFPRPKMTYFAQAFLFVRDNKPAFERGESPFGAGPEDKTVIIAMSSTAGNAILRLMDEEEEDWKGAPEDPARFRNGDPVSIQYGAFVHLFPDKFDPRVAVSAMADDVYGGSRQRRGNSNENSGGFSKYAAFFTPSINIHGRDIHASLIGREALVASKVKPWDKLFRFYSDVEQAHRICRCVLEAKDLGQRYRSMLTAIAYAFSDRPGWLTDEVHSAMASISTPAVQVPAAARQPGYSTDPASTGW